MLITSWYKTMRSRLSRAPRRRLADHRPRSSRLALEGLEDRLLLSNTPVNPLKLVSIAPPPIVKVAEAPLQALSLGTLQGIEGQALGVPASRGRPAQLADIAAFTDPAHPSRTPADYKAVINWGDGSASTVGKVLLRAAGTLEIGPGRSISLPAGFEVQGTHVYKHFGDFTVRVTVTTSGRGSTVLTSTVHVADAPLAPLNLNKTRAQLGQFTITPTVNATEGVKMPLTQLAAFVDTNAFASPKGYAASIEWGDGHHSAGVVRAVNGTGTHAQQIDHFVVLGSNTYAQAGLYDVKVTITDTNDPAFARPLVLHATAKVKDQPLKALKLPAINAAEGVGLAEGLVVAKFKDANPLATAADFVVHAADGSVHPGALIQYGDGATDIGKVVVDPADPTVFDVLTPTAFFAPAGHAYADGDFHLKVTIASQGGSTVTTDTLVHVANAPMTSASPAPVNGAAGQSLNNVLLGTFVDASTSAPSPETDLSATINWGDGTTTAGVVSRNNNGTFSVRGSHTYQDGSGSNPFVVGVSVKDNSSQQTLQFTTSAVIQDESAVLPSFLEAELDSVSHLFDAALANVANVPLVGELVPETLAGIINTFESDLVEAATAGVTGGAAAIRDSILQQLGQAGEDLLRAVPGTSGELVHVSENAGGGFSLELNLHKDVVVSIPAGDLSLVLPALAIQVGPGQPVVNVLAGFDLDLVFGLNGDGTPFLHTDANAANPQGFHVFVTAGITPGMISGSIDGITVALTQGNQQSSFNGSLDLGFTSSPNSSVVSLVGVPLLNANAAVHLQVGLLGDSPALPSVTADLNATWSFNTFNLLAGNLGPATVSLDHVTVDFGRLATKVVKPYVQAIQNFTAPLEGLADFLTSPVPVVNDVAEALGIDNNITFASLLGAQNGATLTKFANFVQAFNSFSVPANISNGSFKVDVGSFKLFDANVPGNGSVTLGLGAGTLLSKLNAPVKTFFTHLKDAGIHVPFLELNGDQARMNYLGKLFDGKTVDLVTADLDVNLSLGFNKTVTLIGLPVIGGLGINFGGSIALHAGGHFALNTEGIASGNLLDGVVIQNAHAELDLSFDAGAALSLLIASASLDARLTLVFEAELLTADTHSPTVTGTDLHDGNFDVATTQEADVSLVFTLRAFGVKILELDAPITTIEL